MAPVGRRRLRPRAAAATTMALPALAVAAELELEGQRQLLEEVNPHACDGFNVEWAQCPGMPDCGECTPVNCEFADWSPWKNAEGCIGLRHRHRDIKTANNECGKPCEGMTEQSEPHAQSACEEQDKDCKWSAWSDWTSCSSDVDQANRTRSVRQQATRHGAPCVGPIKQTKGCGPHVNNPVPCQFESWSAWGTCSATCGEGQRTRSRRIASHAQAGGEACNEAVVQRETCNVHTCPSQDCTVAHWSEWSTCNDQSYPQRYRDRSILVPPSGSGKECPRDMMQTEGCDGVQAQDCDFSEWEDWSTCDRTCEGGTARRERKLLSPNNEGGTCTDQNLLELKGCNEVPCHTEEDNCRLGEWEEWSACSARCGLGLQSRKRRVLANAKNGGRGCEGPLEELLECKERECTENDCHWGEWFEWSSCSASCGGGIKHRSRMVEVSPENGPSCPANIKKEVVPCHTQPCTKGCKDGLWDAWSEWTECSATCGHAFRTRARDVKRQPNVCGHNVTGLANEFELCRDIPKCGEGTGDGDNCQLADWGDWSRCSSDCFGSRERVRFISAFAKRMGNTCMDTPIKAVEPCHPSPNETVPKDCKAKPIIDCELSDWGEWSGCSRTCNVGQRERTRTVKVLPENGGKPCDGTMKLTAQCNTQPCGNSTCKDCLWSDWSDWGDCSGCGGQRYRHRTIRQMPDMCGEPCQESSAREVSNCTSPCTKQLFCLWTDWSDGGDLCGATSCGQSTKSRTRSLDFAAGYADGFLFKGPEDGKCEGEQKKVDECPLIENCTTPCEPKDCKFSTWSEWHHNADNCTGLCERHRVVSEVNNECGKPCDGKLHETKHCDMTCEIKRDCVLSNWGMWTECTANENGQRERYREVLQAPSSRGKPCSGALGETRACNVVTVKPEPYKLSAWSSWGTCSRSCGEGYQTRSRKLLQPAKGEATRFDGSLVETHPCGLEKCEDVVDCELGDWAEWSHCVLGQKTRSRDITRQPANGGRTCRANLRETATCDRSPVDCEVTDWTAWAPCDRTCGGGQTRRERQVVRFPEYGGRECPMNLVETRGCNALECEHRNCKVSDWESWGSCSTTCGVGQQMRSRSVLELRDAEGFGCDESLGETRDCRENPACKRQDCVWGQWSKWGTCSTSCGGGQRLRNRTVLHPPLGGGAACSPKDKEEVGSCSMTPCSELIGCIDGKWADWEPWSPCSASCGGGETFRKRKIMSSANLCGKEPTGSDTEMKFCNVWNPCEEAKDCEFSAWGNWSDCTAPCNGVKRRVRHVDSYGAGKGKICDGALEEYEPCNPGPDEAIPSSCSNGKPVDCKLGQWNAWSDCSATCDGGERVRQRDILQNAMFGGKGCSSPVTQIEECGRNSCSGVSPVDCQFGDWEHWSECSKCAGDKKRFRKILTHARHGGKSCGSFDFMEMGKCERKCDDQTFCVWQDWAEWSDCTATCGNSSKKQRRRYLHLSNAKAVEEEIPPAQDVMAKFIELQHTARSLDKNHFAELIFAFAGGCISLVAASAAVRFIARSFQARAFHTGGDAGVSLINSADDSRGFAHSMPEVELPLVGRLGAGWS